MSTIHKPSQAEVHWLECRLDKGMFSDEIAVTYPPEGITQKSVFVDVNSVQGTPGQRGRVLVRVIERLGRMIAVLPSPNQDIVYVRAEDITGE
jgi:hypothetical protein